MVNDIKRKLVSRKIFSSAFVPTFFELLGWERNYRYKCLGMLKEHNNQKALIFNLSEVEILMPKELVNDDISPLFSGKKTVVAYPKEWSESFGSSVYEHPYSKDVVLMKKKEKKLDAERVIYNNININITEPETIKEEIGNLITHFEKEKTDGTDD